MPATKKDKSRGQLGLWGMSPSKPLCTRSMHISSSCWTRIIYRSFEIILEWGLSIGLEFKSNVQSKSTVSKNIQFDMKYIEKILNRRGQLGLQPIRSSKARKNVFERMPTTKKDKSRERLPDSSKEYGKPS